MIIRLIRKKSSGLDRSWYSLTYSSKEPAINGWLFVQHHYESYIIRPGSAGYTYIRSKPKRNGCRERLRYAGWLDLHWTKVPAFGLFIPFDFYPPTQILSTNGLPSVLRLEIRSHKFRSFEVMFLSPSVYWNKWTLQLVHFVLRYDLLLEKQSRLSSCVVQIEPAPSKGSRQCRVSTWPVINVILLHRAGQQAHM